MCDSQFCAFNFIFVAGNSRDHSYSVALYEYKHNTYPLQDIWHWLHVSWPPIVSCRPLNDTLTRTSLVQSWTDISRINPYYHACLSSHVQALWKDPSHLTVVLKKTEWVMGSDITYRNKSNNAMEAWNSRQMNRPFCDELSVRTYPFMECYDHDC